jgi:hypothetical protein
MSYSLARSPLRLPGSADIEQTYKYVTIKNSPTKCPESRNHVIIKGNLNNKFPNYKRIAIINLHTIISTIHNHIIMSTSSSNNWKMGGCLFIHIGILGIVKIRFPNKSWEIYRNILYFQ